MASRASVATLANFQRKSLVGASPKPMLRHSPYYKINPPPPPNHGRSGSREYFRRLTKGA